MVSKIIEVSRDETEGDPVIDQLFEDFGIELMEENLGVQTIVAICCIYRLVPDPRIRVDLSKVVTFVDDGSTEDVVKQLPMAQPCIVVKRDEENKLQSALVVERSILCVVPPELAAIHLLGAFYIFYMHYTEGCSNFYAALESILLGCNKPGRKTRLAAFLGRLGYSNEE
ncbi:uncharacterized protein [Dysidea avara]|uniref:uncharacterized protein n=1 Tax=Dysidea avara TaxID=196820 RepID=UPI00332AA1CA